MNIQKIINGKTLQLISSKNNTINKSKSETKHKDLNNKRNINYKFLLQEKDNEIHKLKNEIDYYKYFLPIKKSESCKGLIPILRNSNFLSFSKYKGS